MSLCWIYLLMCCFFYTIFLYDSVCFSVRTKQQNLIFLTFCDSSESVMPTNKYDVTLGLVNYHRMEDKGPEVQGASPAPPQSTFWVDSSVNCIFFFILHLSFFGKAETTRLSLRSGVIDTVGVVVDERRWVMKPGEKKWKGIGNGGGQEKRLEGNGIREKTHGGGDMRSRARL